MDKECYRNKPVIFEYEDYRAWLSDLYDYYKATTSYFSYRYFSKRAGFSSPNFLKLVIDGKRNITSQSLEKFVKALRVSRQESHFFRILVQFNQSKSLEEKSKYAKLLLNSKLHQKIHPLKSAQYRYYAHWYYIPIRELVGTPGFVEDVEWISNQFRFTVTPPEVKSALADLESMGLIVRDENSQLRQSHKNLSTESEVYSALVMKYHHDMIRRASYSIESIPRHEREVSGTCIAISKKNIAQIKELVREFRKDILALSAHDAEADMIYQLNFQLFPLAGKPGESEHS